MVLSKFTVLYLPSYFVVYFLKLELILFYNSVVYYHSRIFLILLLHSVEKKVSPLSVISSALKRVNSYFNLLTIYQSESKCILFLQIIHVLIKKLSMTPLVSYYFIPSRVFECGVGVFLWNLSNCKFHRVSWTLLNILAELKNVKIGMVLTLLLISTSYWFFSKSLEIVPSVPTTTGITVTLMFHSFFSSLAWSKYSPLFLQSFSLYSVIHQNGKIH